MPVPKLFKVTRKTFLDPAGWLDLDTLKNQNRTIFQTIKNIFSVNKPLREETFEEAVERLQLTEEDIQYSFKTYKQYAIWFSVLGLLVFLYAFYLIFRYSSITGWLLGIATSALLFSQAFKYDFWAFQIKSRKLGKTFDEWKQNILGGPSQ